jgi:hypothetical protein
MPPAEEALVVLRVQVLQARSLRSCEIALRQSQDLVRESVGSALSCGRPW